jgi:hypothetical protein
VGAGGGWWWWREAGGGCGGGGVMMGGGGCGVWRWLGVRETEMEEGYVRMAQ